MTPLRSTPTTFPETSSTSELNTHPKSSSVSAVATQSDTIPQLAGLVYLFHGNVNVELIMQLFSSFYVGGTKHLNNFDSKRVFEIVEMALPDTASRPMTYTVGHGSTGGVWKCHF